jgi:malate/lactate dehydrogenase
VQALWPPGPHALAAAAVKAIESIGGRQLQTVSCFVAPDSVEKDRTRTAALPVRLGQAGVAAVVLPSLTVVEQVQLDNALML